MGVEKPTKEGEVQKKLMMSLRLPPELIEEIKAAAKKEDISATEFITRACRQRLATGGTEQRLAKIEERLGL